MFRKVVHELPLLAAQWPRRAQLTSISRRKPEIAHSLITLCLCADWVSSLLIVRKSSTSVQNMYICVGTYVYWTVHHLDSWVKRDQLGATCFIITLFSAKHVSDVSTSILRSLRLIRWVTSWVVSGSMCWCYVVVWLGWCGIRMQASACIRIPDHPSQITT